jgi:hypothetical protein
MKEFGLMSSASKFTRKNGVYVIYELFVLCRQSVIYKIVSLV